MREPPSSAFSPCGFCGIDSTSPPPPFQVQCVTQPWHRNRASFSPVVIDWFRDRRITHRRQIRANQSHFGVCSGSGCAHRSRLEPWRHVGWSWGCHLANTHSLKMNPTHRIAESEMQNNWVLVGSFEHWSSCFWSENCLWAFYSQNQQITFSFNSLNQFELDFLALATKS